MLAIFGGATATDVVGSQTGGQPAPLYYMETYILPETVVLLVIPLPAGMAIG